MFNLDPAKLFVIFVVALIVLGPERIPRVARQLGAAWHELTRVREQITDEVRSALPPKEDLEHLRVAYRPGAISQLLSEVSEPRSELRPVLPGQEGTPALEEHDAAGPRLGLDDPSMN